MKKLTIPAGVALAVVLPVFVAFGQSRVDERYYIPLSYLKISDLDFNPELRGSFSAWIRSVNSGDSLGAFDEANRMIEIMRRLGTRNLFSLADLCLAMGESALAKGRTEAAVTAGKHATMFAPDYPGAHFFLARALFSRNRMELNAVTIALARGAKALFMDRIQRDRFISQASRHAFLALLLAFMVTFLTFMAYHYRALLSDIADLIPSRPEGAWKAVLGALVLLTPLALGGWLLFLLAIPLFLWPYLKRGGRAVVMLFVIFILSAPYVFEHMAKGITIANADTYRALYLLSKNTWDYDTKTTLERERAKNPDDTLISFALGLLNKLRGDKDAALESFDAVLVKNPKDLRALVNKGNTYFAAKEYDHAVAMYKEALKVDPRSVEAHFNLSNTYAFMAKTKDSEAEYNAALAIDLDKTRRLVEMVSKGGPENKVVDFPMTSKDLETYERAVAEKTRSVARVLWNVYIGVVSMDVYRWVVLAFVLALAASHLFWTRAISSQVCATCGAPFRPPIRLDSDFPRCNQCVAAQLSKGGVSSAKKDKKRKEIREFLDRQSSKASLMGRVFPGLGRAYHYESVAGFAFVFLTSLVVVYGVSTMATEIVVYKASLSADLLKDHAVFLGTAALYWIIMNTALKKDFY